MSTSHQPTHHHHLLPEPSSHKPQGSGEKERETSARIDSEDSFTKKKKREDVLTTVLQVLDFSPNAIEYLTKEQGISCITRLLATSDHDFHKMVRDCQEKGCFQTADHGQIHKFKKWYAGFIAHHHREPDWEKDFTTEIWDAHVQGYALPPQIDDKPFLDRDIEECLETILHGITIIESDLFPLSRHLKTKLFDMGRMMEYAAGMSSVEERNLRDEKAVKAELIQGSSVMEFSNEFGLRMGGSIATAPVLAKAAVAELRGTGALYGRRSVRFSQHRHQMYEKRLQLPGPSSLKEGEKLGLRDLLRSDAKERIDKIENYEQAKNFMNEHGHIYVRKVYFGSSFIVTAKETAFATTQRWTAGGGVRSSAGSCAAGVFRWMFSRTTSSSSSNTTEKRLGGNPRSGAGRPDERNRQEWLNSLDIGNRTIIQCEFGPIYDLALESTNQSGTRNPYYFLKRVYETLFTLVINNKEYHIKNKHFGDAHLVVHKKLEGKPACRFLRSTNNVTPFDMAHPGSFSLSARHRSGPPVTVLTWDEDRERQKMKAAFKGTIEREWSDHPVKGPCTGYLLPTCHFCSRHSREAANEVAVTTSDDGYLGRRAWRGNAGKLRISSKSVVSGNKNTWHLERVRKNIFNIWTADEKRLLGVEKRAMIDPKGQGEEDSYEYVLVRTKKQDPERTKTIFQWKIYSKDDDSEYADYLDSVPLCDAPDDFSAIAKAYRKSEAADKINLCFGPYRDESGKAPVSATVQEAEKVLLEEDFEYLPMEGDEKFVEKALSYAYGKDAPFERIAAVQTLSGTGACRIAGVFLKKFAGTGTTIYVSDPAWENHLAIFKEAELATATYRYYDRLTKTLDLDGMLEDIQSAPERSVILFHACGHNPTGCDPTKDQWKKVAEVVKEKNHIAFFDVAYQGLVSGCPEQDAEPLRHFVKEDLKVFVAQTFAQNFCLYEDRCGTLSILCSSEEQCENVTSHLRKITRPMYSSLPKYCSSIVRIVLNDENLKKKHDEECKTMATRLKEAREKLVTELADAGSKLDWSHINRQVGMYAYLGITSSQCDFLRENHHIYLPRNGRISLAGLNDTNLKIIAKAIHSVTKSWC